LVAQRTLPYKVQWGKRRNFAPYAAGQQYLNARDESQARVVLDYRVIAPRFWHTPPGKVRGTSQGQQRETQRSSWRILPHQHS
jgi:hypothetical protein